MFSAMKHALRCNNEEEDENEKRGYWANKMEFLLACFSNCWGYSWLNFPFYCWVYGGFPFYTAYFVMLIHIGFPMILLEMAIGQYSNRGVSTVWHMSPMFFGLGVSIVIFLFVKLSVCTHHLFLPAYYMYVTFTSEWTSCNNEWNTERCGKTLSWIEYNATVSSFSTSSFYIILCWW